MANRCFGPTGSIAPFLDHGITRFFMGDGFIDQGGKIIAEYVWIGGTMEDVRSKARTLEDKAWKPEDLPHWNYGERERRGSKVARRTFFFPRTRRKNNVLPASNAPLLPTPKLP